ncbi:MAG: hypothetical protein KGI56_10775, partial [Acidobacteriota bacterium]|nr:hypothetical protein [Acidobacteriota bacterium]
MPFFARLFAGCLATLLLRAQPGDLRIQAVRIHHPIQVDGRLREADWRRAPAATGFIQEWP